jgi:hypothetical protein
MDEVNGGAFGVNRERSRSLNRTRLVAILLACRGNESPNIG